MRANRDHGALGHSVVRPVVRPAWRPARGSFVALGLGLFAVLVLGVALAQSGGSGGEASAGAGSADGRVVEVRFGVATVSADSPAVSVASRVVTLSAPGAYRLLGELRGGRVVVDAAEPGTVTLILDGVGVYAATGPALVVERADEVVLRLAAGSFNNLFDGLERLAGEPGAAVFSGAPLTIEGEGHLLVLARLKHGVVSGGDVTVTGGVLTVNAADDGVRGENLSVNGGDLLVFAANDALKSTGEAEGGGVVALNGGVLDLVSAGDGVQAERLLVVRGGHVSVLSGGGHLVAPTDDSAKGLKADVAVVVEGGTILVDASDDAVHSDGDIRILGGHLTLATGDDAVHADGSLLVADGWVEVVASWEGLEAATVTIAGGTVLVWADDDGLNAAGDGPSSELLLTISGGHVVVGAGSDAIDSNGAVRMTGGMVVLNGPFTFAKPAIDRHLLHSVLLDGATIVAAGSLVLGRATGIDPLSSQAVVYLDFNWLVEEGTLITLPGEEGVVASFRAPQALGRMSFTAPFIRAGEKYGVWLGGEPVGVELLGGVFVPAGALGAEFRWETVAR